MVLSVFSSSFNANITALLSIGSIGLDYCTLKTPLRHGFELYIKVCMASSFASLGNATTSLLKAVMYSYTDPRCCSSHNLSRAIFLLSKRMY